MLSRQLLHLQACALVVDLRRTKKLRYCLQSDVSRIVRLTRAAPQGGFAFRMFVRSIVCFVQLGTTFAGHERLERRMSPNGTPTGTLKEFPVSVL